jgi:hypothetical protein
MLADSVVILCARDELNVTFVVSVLVIDAAREELLVLTLADRVVMLCARDELNVTLVVLVWVMDAASDELLPSIRDDMCGNALRQGRAKRGVGRVGLGNGRRQ